MNGVWKSARSGWSSPSQKSVGDITSITASTPFWSPKISTISTRVIDSRRAIETESSLGGLTLGQALGQSVSTGSTNVRGSGCSICDHAGDGGDWTGANGVLVHVAAVGAVVVLHETGVEDLTGGGGGADTSAGFLHDDCEDEAGVNAGGGSGGGDGGFDCGDLSWRVVGCVELPAGCSHDCLGVGPPEEVC